MSYIKINNYLQLISLFLLTASITTFLSQVYGFIGRPMFFLGLGLYGISMISQLKYVFHNKMLWWYLSFFCMCFLSTLYSDHPLEGRDLILYLAIFHIPVIISVDLYCKSQYRINRLIYLYVFVSVILSLIVLKDGARDNHIRYGWSTTGGQPNTPALNLAAGIAFVLFFYWFKFKRKLSIVLFVLFFITIMLTGSRKIVIYIVGIFGLLGWYRSKNKTKFFKYMIIVSVFMILMFFALTQNQNLYETIGSRIFTNLDEEGSFLEREYLRDNGIVYWLNNPILGNGIDTFKYHNIAGVYAHNNYVELLASLGVVGLVIYYSFLIYITYQLWKHRANAYNFIFFSIMFMTLVIEMYNVNYLQRGIYIIYALAYCQYKIGVLNKSKVL